LAGGLEPMTLAQQEVEWRELAAYGEQKAVQMGITSDEEIDRLVNQYRQEQRANNAAEMLRPLDLPGVRHASLDRVIQVHEPSRDKRKAGASSKRAKIERFEQLLSKVPDVEPEDYDRL